MRSFLFILGLILTVPLAKAEEVVEGGELRGTIDDTATPPTEKPFVSCNGKATAPIRVVYDITRGVQKATVYEGSTIIRTYRISGGRNRKEWNAKEGRVCAYTSVGKVKPKQLIRKRISQAHNNAPMPWYVDLHTERAVGGHQGDISGYSGGCIRQSAKDAKWLYEYVGEHSNLYGDNMISCTDTTFEIVDNTPGVAEARAACFASIGKSDPILTLPPEEVPPIPRNRPLLSGDPLPAGRFSPVTYNKEAYEKQYKYLNEGPDMSQLPSVGNIEHLPENNTP